MGGGIPSKMEVIERNIADASKDWRCLLCLERKLESLGNDDEEEVLDSSNP